MPLGNCEFRENEGLTLINSINEIAHETAICRNPPIYNFTGDRKNLTDINRPTIRHVMFLRQYKEKQFFCEHNVLTEGVFVTQLSSNAGISV
jgi:hypothetical protein